MTELKGKISPNKHLQGAIDPIRQLQGEVTPNKQLQGKATPVKQMQGEIKLDKHFQFEGSFGTVSYLEIVEIVEKVYQLLSETNDVMLDHLMKESVAERLNHAISYKWFIEQAISEKGVEIPDVQPMRSIDELIRQIKQGNLTDEELAEINAVLDEVISETDEAMQETLSGMSIVEKVHFISLCKSSILGAIKDKGVEVPEVQPLRTIGALIEQIGQGVKLAGYLYGHVAKEGATPTHTINGVGYVGAVLPQLPESELQYAVIGGYVDGDSYDDSFIKLFLSKTPIALYQDSYIVDGSLDDGQSYIQKDGSWSVHEGAGIFLPIWSNYDMYTDSGNLYLTASAPIPIYE